MIKSFTLFLFVLWSMDTAHAQDNQLKSAFSNQRGEGHTLSDIPLLSHPRKVDVFFNGEKPKQAYYKVKILDVTAGTIANYNELLKRLQEKAQGEGLDGLMILDIKQAPVYAGIHTAYGTQIYNAQTLYAVGLKYRSNLQYVDTIMKTAEISTFRNGVEDAHYQLEFDMNGYLSDSLMLPSDAYYLKQVDLFQKANAFITHMPPTNYDGQLLDNDVKWMKTDTGEVRYKALYDDQANLASVEIRLPAGDAAFRRVFYYVQYWFKSGHPVERTITLGRKHIPLYHDELTYDQSNRLTQLVRYDASKQKIMQVSYRFYTMDDLPVPEKD